MCSSQFNLTRMFLNSFVAYFLGLMILFHILVNCLRVVSIDCLYVCRVCFVCASHQWCTVGLYCASSASEGPSFQRKKRGVFIFLQKNGIFFQKKNGLTSDLTSTSDVRRQPHPTEGIMREIKNICCLLCNDKTRST